LAREGAQGQRSLGISSIRLSRRLPVMHTETNIAEGPDGDEAVNWLWREWANVLRIRNDGGPTVGVHLMRQALPIGGMPAARLRIDPAEAQGPAFLEATVLPGRGMMLLQARLRLPSGGIVDAIVAPGEAEAARALSGGPEDFAGNLSFSFGGAILAPFANRIRGAAVAGRQIQTDIAGRPVRLPANWSGKAPGAERYAMHGLILASRFEVREHTPRLVTAHREADDFNGRWSGRMRLEVTWRLDGGALGLQVGAINIGKEATPVGIGWHPYFRLPSGDRRQACLRLAARSRVLVDNYDDVLPTGEIEAVAGGAYDFTGAHGRALADLYLDDCFTDLDQGGPLAELRDPASGLGLRISSPTDAVRAVQVFAPPDKPYVVIEPQFNLADPYGGEWGGRDTGMRLLQPGEMATYEARVEPFALDD
jgi:aldose 1-epimerase